MEQNTQAPLTPAQIFARASAGKLVTVHDTKRENQPLFRVGEFHMISNKYFAPGLTLIHAAALADMYGAFQRSDTARIEFGKVSILPPYPPEIVCNVCDWQGCAEQLEPDNSSADHDYQWRQICPTCGNDPQEGN